MPDIALGYFMNYVLKPATVTPQGRRQVALMVKDPCANAGDIRDAVSTPGSEGSPEKGTATHFSIPAGESHGQGSVADCSL